MWIRDWLGDDLAENGCRVRVFTYGYPSQVIESDSNAGLYEYGKTFLRCLVAVRSAEFKVSTTLWLQGDNSAQSRFQEGKTRPLAFICHSLGGLVIKQVYQDSKLQDGTADCPQALKNADQSQDKAEKDILESCRSLVMFGVPNLGMENDALMPLTRGRPNETFAQSLGIGSPFLQQLKRDFDTILRNREIDIIAVYETKDTPTAVEVRLLYGYFNTGD